MIKSFRQQLKNYSFCICDIICEIKIEAMKIYWRLNAELLILNAINFQWFNGYKISFYHFQFPLQQNICSLLMKFIDVKRFRDIFFENNVAILTLNKFKFIHTCVDRHSDVKRFLKDDIDQGYVCLITNIAYVVSITY